MESTDSNIGMTSLPFNRYQMTELQKSQTSLLSAVSNEDTGIQINEVSRKIIRNFTRSIICK